MILGLIEHSQGKLSAQSFEMLTVARGLSQELDMPLAAVVVGANATDLAEALGVYGVETVFAVEDERLTDYAPDAWAQGVVEVMMAENPEAVLAIGTERGNEVMARVAARTNLPFAANCLEITPEDDAYFINRVRWGGTLREEARLFGEPKLLTVAAFSFEAEEADDVEDPEIVTVAPNLSEADLLVRITDRIVPEKAGISLSDAAVVVSGGRGVGSAEGFSKLEELAALIEGAVGCSRAVTNNGWRPHADQVGQTGTRVAPELYIACGISGASQHMAGCSGSKRILVINTDKEAPILGKANYAVIGDLHEVLPAICEALRKR